MILDNSTLANYDGLALRARCRSCDHERELEVEEVAARVGWEARGQDLASKMRCSRCSERSVEIDLVRHGPQLPLE